MGWGSAFRLSVILPGGMTASGADFDFPGLRFGVERHNDFLFDDVDGGWAFLIKGRGISQ